MNRAPIVTFDKELKSKILQAFGKVEKNGQIVEKKGSMPVPAKDGAPFSMEEFGAITKGSEVYIRSDITSLIEYYESK